MARNIASSLFCVENLLAPTSSISPTATLANTQTTNSCSKLTAKVQPFEVRENDLMEPGTPRPEYGLPKGTPNQPFFPSFGYPFASPLNALANFQLYSLWSQAGLVNWPLVANPLFGQTARAARPQTTNQNKVKNKKSFESQESDADASLNSNSATESLLAASECHLAVLRDDDGDTPLHIAIVHENQKLIQKLVGLISFSKLTVNTPNNLSQTPLHLAVLTKQAEVVKLLMNAGADVNGQDRNGQTPVHLCAAHGNIACLNEIFLRKPKNLDLEVKNFDGLTALHVAVQTKTESIVKALITSGANINAKDGKSGHTPLHHAIDVESCEVLQLLVTKGANINEPNFSGVTPIQNANCCRNETISKMLLSQETLSNVGVKSKGAGTNIPTTAAKTDVNAEKDNESRQEKLKRRREASPLTSKRPRTEFQVRC